MLLQMILFHSFLWLNNIPFACVCVCVREREGEGDGGGGAENSNMFFLGFLEINEA